MNPATRMMFDRLTDLASRGFTYESAAKEIGVAYNYVAAFANRHQVLFALKKRGRPAEPPGERERDMLKRYTSGETLGSIGKSYKITRERVRQILTKNYNIRASDGGKSEQAREAARDFRKKRDARALRAYGCSYNEYRRLVKLAGKPTYAYVQQRRNARTRGIDWNLLLWQWWKVWEHSGHWAERGRGRGYAMCRLNDAGPYSIDNVYIATGAENIQDYWEDVKHGRRSRTYKRVAMPTQDSKASMRAAVARYQNTPKCKLRYQLRRQGLPKEQRDAIVAEKFGARP